MHLTYGEFDYLGKILEGSLFGLYSGIFVLHLQYHLSNKGSNNTKQNIILYALCVLYVSCAALIALDVAEMVIGMSHDAITSVTYHLYIAQMPVFGFSDFITQSILIHRCWIVWGRNTRVVIIPSILAFAYLVMWMASTGALFIVPGNADEANWGNTLDLTSLTASMTVNALVTGLIVFRIFKVFHEVKGTTTSDEKSLGINAGRKLRSIIFVIIESGMTLLAIQLARTSMAIFGEVKVWMDAEIDAYALIVCIHQMLNGITPTIILVRVSMGLSFHDEPSLVETVGSLHFADAIPGVDSIGQDGSLDIWPDDPNAISGMVNNNQERKDEDIGGDDVQMVDR